MKEEDKSRLVEVFSGALWRADLLKSILEDKGIPAVTAGGTAVNIALPTINVDVAVLVNECDYEAAMVVVADYKKKEGEE
ncbi:MAG: DUF2007 domain-containing protein [Mediterranea massiliensis]|nr:DUF2007 domain-containing protein [Mediterranea massiliensis]